MAPDQQLKQSQAPVETEADYPIAERVLVPLANPATAEGLLRLAMSLIGEKGRIVATYVIVKDTEPRLGALEKLQEIVDNLIAEVNAPIELMTDMATSIARGILDMAQEQNADLIVLGSRGRQGSKVVLGPVVDAVSRTAPCNILVYRGMQPLYSGAGYKSVTVPVDGSNNSRLAARIGLRFAQSINAPLNALYVQTDHSLRRWQALGMIESSLEDLGDRPDVRKLVVHGIDVVSGILSRCEEDSLLIVGFSEQSPLDSWLFGDIPQRLLTGAPGPLLLVKQMVGETVPEKLGHRLVNLLPTLTPSEEMEMLHAAQEMSKPSQNYFVLVVLSCLIASFGLLLNSSAVIIGAMLIAPLMSPLMGFAVGLTQGNWRLMQLAAFTTLRGIVLALLLAVVVGMVMPFDLPTAEMLARGQPTLPDMAVALFSGMAGAYAMARKDIPSALAGVAIAAALMPPLCTVGIAFSFGLTQLATGALFLFIMNIVSISLAGAAVFLWLGVRLRIRDDDTAHYASRLILSLMVLVLLALPMASSLRSSLNSARERDIIREILQDELNGNVVELQWQKDGTANIEAIMQLLEAPQEEALRAIETRIENRLGYDVDLELVVWQTIRIPEQ